MVLIVNGKHLMFGFLSETFCHGILPLLPREDVCRRGVVMDDRTPKTYLSLETRMLCLLGYNWLFSKISLNGCVAAASNNSQSIWASRKSVHKPSFGLFVAWLVGGHAFSPFEQQSLLRMEGTFSLD